MFLEANIPERNPIQLALFPLSYSTFKSKDIAVATIVASFSGKCLIYAVTDPETSAVPAGQSHKVCCHAEGEHNVTRT